MLHTLTHFLELLLRHNGCKGKEWRMCNGVGPSKELRLCVSAFYIGFFHLKGKVALGDVAKDSYDCSCQSFGWRGIKMAVFDE